MSDDPTTAVGEIIKAKNQLRSGVEVVLRFQHAEGADEDNAAEALKTYIIAQMLRELRQSNPLLSAFIGAMAEREVYWWRLLSDLGWESGGEEIRF